MKLPKKLGKPPVVDTVFEMRFAAGKPLSNILPGLVLPTFKGENIERLPAAQIPEALRNADETMKFAPLVRVHWGPFMVLASDRSVGIACKMPYAGWTAYKAAILQIAQIIAETAIVDMIERFSIKYTNIISGLGKAPTVVDLSLKLGQHDAAQSLFLVRAEIPKEEMICVVQIAAEGTIMLTDGATKTGVVIDVDTLCMGVNLPFSEFSTSLPDRLERIHSETKTMFFSCLKQEALEKLEPVYD
jgi:uncharacterized protein (TIGR04255 family)